MYLLKLLLSANLDRDLCTPQKSAACVVTLPALDYSSSKSCAPVSLSTSSDCWEVVRSYKLLVYSADCRYACYC